MSSTGHPTPGELPASPRQSWSLTLWLTCCNAVSAFLLMSLIAGLLYGGLDAQLKEQNHRYLHDEIRTLENMITARGVDAAIIKEAGAGHSGKEYVKHYIRLMDRHEQVLVETPGMGEMIHPHAVPIPVRSSRTAVDRTWRAPDGSPMLTTMVWVDLQEGDGQQGILQVALDVTNVDQILVGYREKICLVLCLGFLLCFVVSYVIARRGTRPLREITGIVRRITVTNLEERFAGRGWPQELTELSDAMNLMLNRLEDSFARLHKSAQNLSHKMRTPLTILRGEAEVALSSKRSVEELQDVIASSLEEVGRLSRLADNVLFLANAEMGIFQMSPAVLNAREEVEEVMDFYSPFAEEKGVRITCRGEASLIADPVLFRKSVAALISNAVTYNQPEGTVVLDMRQMEGLSVELAVTDSGCGIAADEMVKIFDRFYRIYATRYMDPHGTGLGLPIAKAIMDLHDGTIAVQSEPGQGTTVTLTYPASSASAAPSSPSC